MSALAPAALESNALALRLRELAGEERNVQVEFLLHLDEFDRRRAFVLREAIRCGIERHGKRKGAVAPDRKTKEAKQPAATCTISAIVRRAVWKRDGGRCAWVGPEGCRCDSRWKLELDHIQPVALGGPSTIDNLRLVCRAHNLLHAERTFGREHMDRFRRAAADGPTPHAPADGAAPLRHVMQLGMWAP